MTETDIEATIQAYVRAADRAIKAGFDGVELHAANGYLIHQFLADNTNRRDDDYGIANGGRHRFLLELVDRTRAALGPGRLAIRLSPGNPENGVVEDDPASTYRPLVEQLNGRGLAYLHLSEKGAYPALADLRPVWDGTLIGNFDPPEPSDLVVGDSLVRAGLADLISYGRLFIANPDLPARFASDSALNPIDRAHLYAGGARGYTDYPTMIATEDEAALESDTGA